MKKQRNFIVVLVIVLLAVSTACNLLSAIQPSEPESPPVVNEPDSSQPDSEESQPKEQEADEPAEEVDLEQETVEEVSSDDKSWLVMTGNTSITYFSEKDMAAQTVNLNGYLVSAAPSPDGGKVAIVRSEGEYEVGMLWFDLLDLATGQLTTITPLANDQTVMDDWETSEICQPPREANFATTISEPVWRPDGTAVVFISAHDGLFAKPYAYHVNTGQINHLSLGGEAHYYHPVISPDGEHIAVPSASCFGTGAGLTMDSYSMARVSGGEAGMIADVSEASNVITWGWLDNQTVVYSVGDIMAKAKNLRAVDIYNGSVMEITGPNDYVDQVAVGTDTGAVLFVTMMEDMSDYIEGNTIGKDALYLWNVGMQQFSEISDRVVWGSFVEWNPATSCFYAELSSVGDEADSVQPFTSAGTINDMTCRPLTANVKNTPDFSFSLDYFAWEINSWDESTLEGLYVQGFTENREVRLTDSYGPYDWYPTEDILAFAQGSQVFYASQPEFMLTQVLSTPEEVLELFWVQP